MNIEIIQANLDDAQEILTLQQLAYEKEARLCNDWNIPPLIQTLPELQQEFDTSVFVKAILGGRIIGSVRGKTESDTCLIDRHIVHPEFQRKGIGTSLMQSIEVLCPSAKRFELFTGTMNTDNIRLYERLGYTAYRQDDSTPQARIVFMEKHL